MGDRLQNFRPLERFRRRADDLAERRSEASGGQVEDTGAPAAAGMRGWPSARERGSMRRRLRSLRRQREAMLLELGALAYELRRGGGKEELLAEKAEALRAVDDEARGLAGVLDTDGGLDEVVVAGIGGPCPRCGALRGSRDSYCAACGAPLQEGAS